MTITEDELREWEEDCSIVTHDTRLHKLIAEIRRLREENFLLRHGECVENKIERFRNYSYTKGIDFDSLTDEEGLRLIALGKAVEAMSSLNPEAAEIRLTVQMKEHWGIESQIEDEEWEFLTSQWYKTPLEALMAAQEKD